MYVYYSSPTFRGSYIRNNNSYGIHLDGSSNPNLGDANNGQNDIYGNTTYELYNNTTNTIAAEGNYWGVDTTDPNVIDALIYDDDELATRGEVDFTDWQGSPTAVVLSSFTATADDSKVTIQWTTESEINTAGFNVYRSKEENSGYVKLNDSLIPGSDDSTTGQTYSFIDKSAANGITYYYKLEEIELDGVKNTYGQISVTTPIEEVTEKEKEKVVPDKTEIEPPNVVVVPKLPEKFLLAQNFPNPFNPDTWIPYALPEGRHVIVKIYNISGQLVRTLDFGDKPAGEYFTRQKAVYWDGKDQTGISVSTGLYFYTLKAGGFDTQATQPKDFIATRRMLIVK